MGLFDFFKSKNKITEKVSTSDAPRAECDITKTQVIVELLQVSKDQRDDAWKQKFLDNVQTASFSSENPQIFTGPDGFAYFKLRTPEPNKPFESFCIRNLKDFLLENGFGVAINTGENSVDWVFSHGDIVNLHLRNEFFTKAESGEIKSEETLSQGAQILIAQPSESYLPGKTRKALRAFLQSIGVEKPKVMMVCRKNNGTFIQELAFNIFREDFNNPDELNNRMAQISWFLPRHYIIVSFPKKSDLTDKFQNL